MTFLFAPHIKKNEIVTYIDNILIQIDRKTQMFGRLRTFYESLGKSKPKAARDKTFFFLAAINFLSHVYTKNKIRPLANKIEAIQQMKRPESKKMLWNCRKL